MQRKAYVSGVAALLAATVTLAGCTGSDGGDEPTDSKQGGSGTTAASAQPGRYRTLPEPCAAVDQGTLDSLLPGIKQVTDQEQREKAYAGTATLTYDTDRKVGCRWKAEATSATDHLWVDFERVVSYDNAVSDESRASQLYVTKEVAADLPEPSPSPTDEPSEEGTAEGAGEGTDEPEGQGESGSPQSQTPTPDPTQTPASDESSSPTDDDSAASDLTSTPSSTPA
ncbi:DUF3558 domain-containing protein, partial [Streptomyces scabichelini]|uniref:DUF3558 domain-containing protein n=1 Tax=Streptomyces scabichelini TaxID=2711217 RepID=UPI0030BA14C6